MRIGIDCRMYRSSVAGIGRYSQNLIKNLLEIDQNDEFVLFMTPEDKKEFENSIKIENLKLKIIIANIPHFSLTEQTKFGRIIAAENLDLMHFLNFNHPINYKGKFIVTIHDLTLLLFPKTAKETNIFKYNAFKHVMKKAIMNSSKIIAVSQSTKKDIIKFFKAEPKKIEVIYEAADDKTTKLTADSLKLKALYNVTCPVILYVGQFREHKNLRRLIDAFEILRKVVKCKLVLLGNYESETKKNSLLGTSQFKNDIILPGFVTNQELEDWYQISTCLVFPSLYEGFGLPGLEAMQAGLPVVASNVSSLPEIYQNGALYFNPLDKDEIAGKIKEVITNQKLRQDLILKGIEVVKKYSWRKTAQETLDLYKQIQKT